MENWDEIRTAYQVARLGTVSGAAEVLGVHHATVIRHIDALEKHLGTKLFQRHARGYTATEAGRDLLTVAKTTEEQFGQLISRIKGLGETVTGELVVTAITGIADLMTPVFSDYMAEYPAVKIRFLTDMRVFRLDYGEAHVAIRAGGQPQELDYVAQPLLTLHSGLYGSKDYIDRFGLPKDDADLVNHRFISSEVSETRAPFYRWLRDTVPEEAIRFRITEPNAALEGLKRGLGLGFCDVNRAKNIPDLIEVFPPRPEWDAPLWIVTHVDLHRTLKVQSFLAHLKKAAATWATTCL
jgi:DNA-binding transcriptional LysR family regulator